MDKLKSPHCKLPRVGARSPTLQDIRALTIPVFNELKCEVNNDRRRLPDFIQMPMLFGSMSDSECQENEKTMEEQLKSKLEKMKQNHREKLGLVKRYIRDYDISQIRHHRVLTSFTIGRKIHADENNDSKINTQILHRINGVCYRKCLKKQRTLKKKVEIAKPQEHVFSTTNLNTRTHEYYEGFAKECLDNDRCREDKRLQREKKKKMMIKQPTVYARLGTNTETPTVSVKKNGKLDHIAEEEFTKISKSELKIHESANLISLNQNKPEEPNPIRYFSQTRERTQKTCKKKRLECSFYMVKAKQHEQVIKIRNGETIVNHRRKIRLPRVNNFQIKIPTRRVLSKCLSGDSVSRGNNLSTMQTNPTSTSSRKDIEDIHRFKSFDHGDLCEGNL